MAMKSELGTASNPIVLGLSPIRKVLRNTAVQVEESDSVQSTAEERKSQQEPDPTAVWISSNLEPLLSCSICTEIFYKPVNVVPCGHNFCLPCLMQSVVISVNCPQCREKIQDVGLDYTINSIVDVFLEQNPGKIRPLDELKRLDNKYLEAVMELKRMKMKRLRVVDRSTWDAARSIPGLERELFRDNRPASPYRGSAGEVLSSSRRGSPHPRNLSGSTSVRIRARMQDSNINEVSQQQHGNLRLRVRLLEPSRGGLMDDFEFPSNLNLNYYIATVNGTQWP